MIASRDHAALMTAIIADPDDDLPRLAFADYCEEIGEVERGELVRVQLESEKPCDWRADYDGLSCPEYNAQRVPAFRVQVRCKTCEMRSRLAVRERQLLEDHGAEWCEWLALSVGLKRDGFLYTWGYEGGTGGRRWLWNRGFVEEIHAPLADWVRLSSEWREKTPLRVYKPLKLPGERLTRPELFGNVIRLWQCENVGRLHTLDLTSIVASADAGDDDRWYPMFTSAADHAFRPWRGLKRVVIPSGGLPALAQSRRHWWEATITGIEVAFVHPVAPETAS